MPPEDDENDTVVRLGEPERKRARSDETLENDALAKHPTASTGSSDKEEHGEANPDEADPDEADNTEEDEDGDEEEEEGVTINLDDMDDEELMRLLSTVASARGIPLEMLLGQAGMAAHDDDDDEDLEYPFGQEPATNLRDVAEFIQSEKCKKILIIAGAGMSCSAGIPDYRSAGGFYETLPAERLTATLAEQEAIRADPTFALEKGLFLSNPFPCLELKRDFILGTFRRRWKATLAHRFVELLHGKTGKLARLYTQNIDGLEDQCTNLPASKVVAVHGSMDRAECLACETETDYSEFCEAVKRQIKDVTGTDTEAPHESTPIKCQSCGEAAVKPAIVLFRSSLPRLFFDRVPEDVTDVDLLIVLGTSLRVAPANSLVWRVPKSCLRVVINREAVGRHLGIRHPDNVHGKPVKRDYHAAGDCDDLVLELMEHLGWLDDLEPHVDDLPASCSEKLRIRLSNRRNGMNPDC